MNKALNLTINIRASIAESGPPLGTILGNIGVNTLKFCKEFNDFTQDLPNFLLLRVHISVAENKTFTFLVYYPSLGFLIFLLKKEVTGKTRDGIFFSYYYILLEDFLKLAKLKLPGVNLKEAAKIIKGSLLSANIKLLKDDVVI